MSGSTTLLRDHGSLVLTLGGVLGGFFIVRELLKKLPWVHNPEACCCPLQTKTYGGLPEVGGYGSSTEYEVGAQRIAEAAHCILGSLGKLLTRSTWEHGLHYEAGHIVEEMDIINKSAKEYSRSLYRDRLLPSYQASRSVDSIRKASQNLVKVAEKNLSALGREDLPLPVFHVADNAYRLVISLATAMEKASRGIRKRSRMLSGTRTSTTGACCCRPRSTSCLQQSQRKATDELRIPGRNGADKSSWNGTIRNSPWIRQDGTSISGFTSSSGFGV